MVHRSDVIKVKVISNLDGCDVSLLDSLCLLVILRGIGITSSSCSGRGSLSGLALLGLSQSLKLSLLLGFNKESLVLLSLSLLWGFFLLLLLFTVFGLFSIV